MRNPRTTIYRDPGEPVRPVGPELMTVKEVADYLRLSPRQVMSLVSAKTLKGGRMGANGHWRFRRSDVEAALDKFGSVSEDRYDRGNLS